MIAAFFSVDNDKKRKARLEDLAEALAAYFANPHHLNLREPLDVVRRGLTSGDKPINPFHWEIEFPEVFDRENGGFDAFIGNPPFAGKNTLIAGNRDGFIDWLKTLHEESHGVADLVAHFFRLAFDLLREQGSFGLIATNTVGQGDTRSTGLRWICKNGGTLYEATRRKKWPGLAAVVISVFHCHKGSYSGPYFLDSHRVPIITAYLFHAGGHDDPARSKVNEGNCFQGSIVLYAFQKRAAPSGAFRGDLAG